jgi:hypothetical protein
MGRQAVRWLVRLAVAAVFALSWRHDLFLMVVAMPAGAITLAVQDRLSDRSDARRAAALALVAPTRVADATAVERIVAADLAAASMGDAATLDRALRLAEHSVEDPRQRALACERLEAAKQMLVGTTFAEASLATALGRRSVRLTAGFVMVGALVAVGATGHKPLLAPLGLALAALTLAVSELRRWEGLCELLVRQATIHPATGRVVVPDEAVVSAISALTGGRPRVRQIARRVVAAWPEPERAVAFRRLELTGTAKGRLSRLDHDIAACAVAAAALAAVLERL